MNPVSQNHHEMHNQLTEKWAIDLAQRTPPSMVPVLIDVGPWWPWSDAAPIVRQTFRARVEQFLDGDVSVIPDINSTPCYSSV
jgi:hypothetical protein